MMFLSYISTDFAFVGPDCQVIPSYSPDDRMLLYKETIELIYYELEVYLYLSIFRYESWYLVVGKFQW
jgi:hypothetical protein